MFSKVANLVPISLEPSHVLNREIYRGCATSVQLHYISGMISYYIKETIALSAGQPLRSTATQTQCYPLTNF